MISTFDRFRFARRCEIPAFVSLGPKNHNMHHRTSTDFDLPLKLPAMCDICFVYIGSKKSQHASSHIDRFRFASRCAISVLYILARKNHNMHHRTSSRKWRLSNKWGGVACAWFGWSMCDIRLCISWPEKAQDAYRTSRPIRFGWSMCDIRLCISWPEKAQDADRTSRPIRFGWSMIDIRIRPC